MLWGMVIEATPRAQTQVLSAAANHLSKFCENSMSHTNRPSQIALTKRKLSWA